MDNDLSTMTFCLTTQAWQHRGRLLDPAIPGKRESMLLTDLQDKAGIASELLKVMANENRLQIMCQLVNGEKSVQELEGALSLRQSALSQHLAILRREKIVKTRRQAQFIYYALDSAEAKIVMTALYSVFCAPAGKARKA